MATLTRRFIIICLIFVIFALWMAAAVANADHASRSWRDGPFHACVFHPDLNCRASR